MGTNTQPYYEEGELDCERLVRVVQNRDGKSTAADRDKAMVDLLDSFRYLIKKVTTAVWQTDLRISYDDLRHETATQFVEFVIDDYTPKRFGGSAMFGPYIKTKLRWKMIDYAQKTLRRYSRETSSSWGCEQDVNNWDGDQKANTQMDIDMVESIYAVVTDAGEEAVGNITNVELLQRIRDIRSIAKRILSDKEYRVWETLIFGASSRSAVGDSFDPPITRRRVNQLFNVAQLKVLAEYSRHVLSKVVM